VRVVLAAGGELAEAEARAAAARAALGVVGSDGAAAGRFPAVSPIRGQVTRREAAPGRVVAAGDVLFEVVDTSVMWAEIDVPEARAAGVAAGRRAVLRLRGAEGPELEGAIAWVAPEIDPHSRSVRSRVILANPDGRLRANQYAEARIEGAPRGESTLVPASAVQRVGPVAFVFVRLAEDRYEVRRVRLGPRDGERLAVGGALREGDEVVTAGSFLLKTETLRGSIGAGCCAVE
jgi:cobalt-zinc-cadmium efflux system membrane fusion protein